jgi:acyl-CoA synthetase (AMP-forming)/AMP-acid ligase II
MLGNVPELVILAMAVSKLQGVLVPLDPTTVTRDLDMILDAAPLRALVTRPHGEDSPFATPAAPARADGRKTTLRHVPESRRRLQGTLLNCRAQAETPPNLGMA